MFEKGKPSWNKGLTKETSDSVRRISEAKQGENNPQFQQEPWNKGKKGYFSKDALSRINTFEPGRVPWNKGKHLSEEHVEKLRLSHKGQISACGMKGKTHSAETRRKMRIARIASIKRQVSDGGNLCPTYSAIACRFFDWFDKQYQTTGQYATKGGEYFIEELGYFVDYFNPEMRVIIEWDEEHGHYRNGKLREKDIRRQEEIMRHLPDYELLRIREKHFDVSQLSEVA